MRHIDFIRIIVLFCTIGQLLSAPARAQGFGGFLHRVQQGIQNAAHSVSNAPSDEESEDEPDPENVPKVAATPEEPVVTSASTSDHPQLLEIHFNPSTDHSQIELTGFVNASTDNLQLIWTTLLPSRGLRIDQIMVPLSKGFFKTSITLNYGPGTYSIKTRVGIQGAHGVSTYADAEQNAGNVINTDPIPYADRIANGVIQSDSLIIQQLARSIVRNVRNEYEEVRLIHDWVAMNISYDDAQIKTVNGVIETIQTENDNSSLMVLHYKKGICAGYANLTAALLRAVGIPAKVVGGPTLPGPNDHWDDSVSDQNKPNQHAWNEAYANGRWVVMDTTWDHRSGQKYFDPDPVIFAKNHRDEYPR